MKHYIFKNYINNKNDDQLHPTDINNCLSVCVCVTNVTVPWSQSVVSAGAAGPQCVPSHCPAGWPAAPSSLSAAQKTNYKSVTSDWTSMAGQWNHIQLGNASEEFHDSI